MSPCSDGRIALLLGVFISTLANPFRERYYRCDGWIHVTGNLTVGFTSDAARRAIRRQEAHDQQNRRRLLESGDGWMGAGASLHTVDHLWIQFGYENFQRALQLTFEMRWEDRHI